jgi:hypothetical protein
MHAWLVGAFSSEAVRMNVVIGGTGIRISTSDAAFEKVLRTQYEGFIEPDSSESIKLTVNLTPPSLADPDADIQVRKEADHWVMNRGDFLASYDSASRAGSVRQSASRHSIDSVIRIIHSLHLAERSGFLLHAASVIRADRALIFAGPSGAGKTTISRLAPEDAHLLTDEISYVRKLSGSWTAFGTPFAGDLARPGENRSAGVEALFLLKHGAENRIKPLNAAAAVRAILRNVLFFADDSLLARRLFDTVCEFVCSIRVFELSFLPDTRVWSLIK